MGSRGFRAWVPFAVLVALPIVALAQEATISGTVTDTTGAVLPGVTITAVHEASGNVFENVTDASGAYRIPARTGTFRISAALPGFATVTRTGLEVLVGQQVVANLQLAPSGLQESVTVTGEAPLIDLTQSAMGGNVDPRQISELPVLGRNWMNLALLAPGSRGNAVDETPVADPNSQTGGFQLNIDGQQVTNVFAYTFGQPRTSQDAIAEFQFVSSRFDATQGYSSGVQINVITKSGTNTLSGSVSSFFRDDRFNAADPVAGVVLPYSNQQVSSTLGGPIRRDRIHFFGNYEYEREPQTFHYSTPYPSFNIDQTGTREEHKWGGRVDVQHSPQTRVTARLARYGMWLPYDPRFAGGATRHPSAPNSTYRQSVQGQASLMNVLGNRGLNEVRVAFNSFYWRMVNEYTVWPDHPVKRHSVGGTEVRGAPTIQLRGLTIGQGNLNTPQQNGFDQYLVRDTLTYSFTKRGRHDLKIGGEYLDTKFYSDGCPNCAGTYDAQGGSIPANLEQLFPVWNDVSTWNLAALSPIIRRYNQGIGNFHVHNPRDEFSAWIQDDWGITRRLTLNLGLRYDLTIGAYAEYVSLPPFIEEGRPANKTNFGPRLGFAFRMNEQTVLRGGFGKYFAYVGDQPSVWTKRWTQLGTAEVLNDGRPDFGGNPFNGPTPTFEEFVQRGVTRSLSQLATPGLRIPHSYHTSIGVARQLGAMMAVEADYVYKADRNQLVTQNINLSYNAATGANYPFTDISRRPYPTWGTVSVYRSVGRGSYHALETAFTKRFNRGWQASATYALSGYWDEGPLPTTDFPLAPDMGGEWTLAASDQRHRAVFNGIWQVGHGFQVSGLYFFGSGERMSRTYGGDLRRQGANAANRLRPDGTIVPRNDFVGEPIHRVDARIQQRFDLGGGARVDGILELFNVFNRANFGSYVTNEANARFGQPQQSLLTAYSPRMLQLGLRVTF